MATRRTSDSTRTPPTPATKSATPKAADATKGVAKPGKANASVEAKPPVPAPAKPSATSTSAPAKRVAKPKASKGSTAPPKAQVSEETRRAMIAESAYLRAERRGFAPGHEVEDWCAAEREVNALLNANTGASSQ